LAGELQAALLDLDAWVLDDVAPPASSNYEVTDDNQVTLPEAAEDRGGVQPAVSLAVRAGDGCDDVAGDVRAEVAAGDPVAFSMAAAVPPGAGEVVRVEWDPESTGTYPDEADLDETAADVELCGAHTYEEPGTCFAIVRVTARRDGDAGTPYGLVQNLARVRVVVV